jgi:hypothetical protein
MTYGFAGTGALLLRETAEAGYVSAETRHAPAARTEQDAWTDPDALEELGDRIATLAAHIHAADYRLLVLLEEFDRRRGFEPSGHRSCAEWLHFRTGLDMNTAREKVRAARALVDLPETSAAMARGELSFAKVRAVTRAATPETEAELVAFARGATVAETERFVRAWRKLDRLDEEAFERERHRSRRVSIRPDEGMYVIRGRLEHEVGALLMRAIEMAADEIYRTTARSEELEPTQRWADALGLIAERVMAVGFGAEDVSAETHESDREHASAARGLLETGPAASAKAVTCGCAEAPVSGSRAERYQVVLHVDTDTLSEGGEGGRSHLEDGTRVSAETARRLSCDSAFVRIRRGPDGSVLDVGRRTRSIPPAIRRALEIRDGGCRFPGCGLRFTSGHHIVHWADGGPTSLENLILLCRFHHRLIHQEGFGVEWDDLVDGPAFQDPRGRRIPDWPAPARLPGDPVEALVRAHMKAGIDPHALTASSRWKSQPDIPWVEYVRVLEALDRDEEAEERGQDRSREAGVLLRVRPPRARTSSGAASPAAVSR